MKRLVFGRNLPLFTHINLYPCSGLVAKGPGGMASLEKFSGAPMDLLSYYFDIRPILQYLDKISRALKDLTDSLR